MSHDEGWQCHCVTEHRPAPLELERHHIHPLGLGGPDVVQNVAWVCPTTHTNVHELLRWFINESRVVPWRDVTDRYEQAVSRYAYDLAKEGYQRYVAALA